MNQRTTLSLAFLAALGLASPAAADVIHRIDGTPLEDVKVLRADLKEVEYSGGGKGKQVLASDKVLRIEHQTLPKLLDRAEETLRSGDLDGALQDVESYVDSIFSGRKTDSSFPWAPAWALYRLTVLRGRTGDFAGVVQAADRLLQEVPDSFHVPAAWLAKAEALAAQDKAERAVQALRELGAFAQAKGLSERWKLEAELALAELDPALDGAKRRDALSKIAARAGGEFPVVRMRAEVAEAEILVREAEFAAAQSTLERVVDSGGADDRTLAAAWTGLGDCHFQAATKLFKEGKQEPAQERIRSALLAYMRVVVSFADQPRYVSRAMFFAGRAFDQLQEDEAKARAQRMYREVLRQFPASEWAKEARDFRR